MRGSSVTCWRSQLEKTVLAMAFLESRLKKLILVVEDEPGNAELLRFFLEAEGYRVAVASNGKVGLEFLAGEEPEAILSDFVRPDVSGAELGLAIRDNPRLDDIPFVVLSGTSEAVVRETFADYDAFVAKPYWPEALMRVVADLVTHGRPARS